MITRVYFLKASQANKQNGVCHTFRTMTYNSWLAPKIGLVVCDFFDQVSEAKDLPSNGWILESFTKVK